MKRGTNMTYVEQNRKCLAFLLYVRLSIRKWNLNETKVLGFRTKKGTENKLD